MSADRAVLTEINLEDGSATLETEISIDDLFEDDEWRLLEAARELTEAEAQLRVWAKKHGINLRRIADGTASIIVEASSKREAWRELLEGFELWTEARSDPVPFSVDADHYLELEDGRRDPILFENVIKTRAR